MNCGIEPTAVPSTVLAIPRPFPDETLSSVLDRAGSLYRLDRRALAEELLVRRRGTTPLPREIDWDSPPDELVEALAASLSMDAVDLAGYRLVDGPGVLQVAARDSYCLECFHQDMSAGHMPFFRRKWAMLHVTICPEHRVPMSIWRSPSHWEGRFIARGWKPRIESLRAQSPYGAKWRGRALADFLTSWEAELGDEIAKFGDLTQSEDRITRVLARLLMVLGTVQYETQGSPSCGTLTPTQSGWLLDIHGSSSQKITPSDGAWDRFRRVANPNERRACFWLAAATMNCFLGLRRQFGFVSPMVTGGRDWWDDVLWRHVDMWSVPEVVSLWDIIYSYSSGMHEGDVPEFRKEIAAAYPRANALYIANRGASLTMDL